MESWRPLGNSIFVSCGWTWTGGVRNRLCMVPEFFWCCSVDRNVDLKKSHLRSNVTVRFVRRMPNEHTAKGFGWWAVKLRLTGVGNTRWRRPEAGSCVSVSVDGTSTVNSFVCSNELSRAFLAGGGRMVGDRCLDWTGLIAVKGDKGGGGGGGTFAGCTGLDPSLSCLSIDSLAARCSTSKSSKERLRPCTALLSVSECALHVNDRVHAL